MDMQSTEVVQQAPLGAHPVYQEGWRAYFERRENPYIDDRATLPSSDGVAPKWQIWRAGFQSAMDRDRRR